MLGLLINVNDEFYLIIWKFLCEDPPAIARWQQCMQALTIRAAQHCSVPFGRHVKTLFPMQQLTRQSFQQWTIVGHAATHPKAMQHTAALLSALTLSQSCALVPECH